MSPSPEETLKISRFFGIDAEIVRAPANLSVVEHDKIDRSPGQVIIDSSTIFAAARAMPLILEHDLEYASAHCSPASIDGALSLIQSLVIHDCIWVDALTFARSQNGSGLASNLSEFVKGFAVRSQDVYDKVWGEVTTICQQLVKREVTNVDIGLALVDEIDRQYMHPDNVISRPQDCPRASRIIFVFGDGSTHLKLPRIPDALSRSDSGFPRTLFYLTLSAETIPSIRSSS